MDPAEAFGEYIGANDHRGRRRGRAWPTRSRRPGSATPNLYYEDGYQEYANRGGEVRAATIGDVPWVEVDNHDDLAKARDIACRY